MHNITIPHTTYARRDETIKFLFVEQIKPRYLERSMHTATSFTRVDPDGNIKTVVRLVLCVQQSTNNTQPAISLHE